MLSLAILCTTAHTCAGCNDQLFASSGKPGARAPPPVRRVGTGAEESSLPAFWAQTGWEGGVEGRLGWGGGPGGSGAAGQVGGGLEGRGRVGAEWGWVGQGGMVGWRAGWGWAGWGGGWCVRSYSPTGCLYGGVKNALRNRVGLEIWRKVVVVWRKVVITWRKGVKCWSKNSMVRPAALHRI